MSETKTKIENSLSPNNKRLFEGLNLSLSVKPTVSALNPRHTSKSVWVGVDLYIAEHLHMDRTIKAAAKNFFDEMDIDVATIYWTPVSKTEIEGGVYYKLEEDLDNDLDPDPDLCFMDNSYNEMGGFLYLYKDKLETNDNLDIYSTARNLIKKEINDYNAWQNGKVVDVFVETYAGKLKAVSKGSADIDEGFSKAVAKLLNEVDQNVNALSMTLKATDMSSSEPEKILNYLTTQLSNRFDVSFIYGNFDIENDKFTISFIADYMPSLQTLKDDYVNGLLKSMEKQSKRLVSLNQFEDLDAWTIVDALSERKCFTDLPPLLGHALIYSLMDRIDGVELVALSYKNK